MPLHSWHWHRCGGTWLPGISGQGRLKAIRPTRPTRDLGFYGGVVNAKGGILFFFSKKNMVPNLNGWCKFLVEKYQICTGVFCFLILASWPSFLLLLDVHVSWFSSQKNGGLVEIHFFLVNHITTSLIMDFPKGGWTWALKSLDIWWNWRLIFHMVSFCWWFGVNGWLVDSIPLVATNKTPI